MNKKLILVLALAAGGYYLYSQSKTSASATGALPSSGTGTADSVFTDYNNQVIIDSDGIWMLVKDGKLYSPVDQLSLDNFVAANPGTQWKNITYSVWGYWAGKDNSKFGGNF